MFTSFQSQTELTGWTGSRNVYRVGNRPWRWDHSPELKEASLKDWRQRWNSDADSFEADPVDYDPLQWRLLPDSPGYRAGPEGKDLGADVDRVGRTTTADDR